MKFLGQAFETSEHEHYKHIDRRDWMHYHATFVGHNSQDKEGDADVAWYNERYLTEQQMDGMLDGRWRYWWITEMMMMMILVW